MKLLPSDIAPLPDARGFFAVGLHRPKTPANVGSVLRAAACFGAAFVATSPAKPRYHGAPTDTLKAPRHMPLLQLDDLHDAVPHDCVPVVIEVSENARSLVDYIHPRSAFYIFGPEDGAVSASWARDAIVIPAQYCLNLAAAVNVVLYDRIAKASRQKVPTNGAKEDLKLPEDVLWVFRP